MHLTHANYGKGDVPRVVANRNQHVAIYLSFLYSLLVGFSTHGSVAMLQCLLYTVCATILPCQGTAPQSTPLRLVTTAWLAWAQPCWMGPRWGHGNHMRITRGSHGNHMVVHVRNNICGGPVEQGFRPSDLVVQAWYSHEKAGHA